MGSVWNVTDDGYLTNQGSIDTQAIKLPTIGGFQSLLEYYEGDQDYALETSFYGPWGATEYNNKLNFTRIGNVVTMQWTGIEPQAVTTPSVNMRSFLDIPPRFIPPSCDNVSISVPVYNGPDITGNLVTGTMILLYDMGLPYVFFSKSNLQGFDGAYAGMPPGAASWLAIFPT